MALLGKLIDKLTASFAQGTLAGATLGTFNHSLAMTGNPNLGLGSLATTPDAVIPVLRSVANLTGQAAPALLGMGANGSLSTVGIVNSGPSAATLPANLFDIFTIVFHSVIR
jgi:hypothetical protein